MLRKALRTATPRGVAKEGRAGREGRAGSGGRGGRPCRNLERRLRGPAEERNRGRRCDRASRRTAEGRAPLAGMSWRRLIPTLIPTLIPAQILILILIRALGKSQG